MRGVLQVLALERDQALMAGGVGTLVDGHGEMARAEQRAAVILAGSDCSGDAVLVETGQGAHLAGCGVVDHQHAYRPVALGLQDETAFELKHRTEQDREHDCLAQEPRDRRGIGVPAQNGVDRRTKPQHAPTQIESRHFKRQDRVVGGGVRRRAHGNIGGGIRHPNPSGICVGGHAGPSRVQRALASRHHAKMPFWACRRFSASSNTIDCGPSITSSVTSSPRWAGRQCMNTASGFARAISRAFT